MTMSDRRTIVISAMMVTAGPVSMALLTPALPDIARHFGVDAASVALTLTWYLAGFAGGQLVAGPLADRFGRRPIALAFAAVYLLASVVALLAPALHILFAARLLQGIGVSSGLVVSRAMVRDSHSGPAATRILAAINICNAVMPMISPALGAISAEYMGWRFLFDEMAAYGAVLMLTLALFQRETLHAEIRGLRVPVSGLIATYLSILHQRAFIVPALAIGCAIGIIYVASILLPFLLMDRLGLSTTGFGLVMGLQTLSFFCASILCTRMSAQHTPERLFTIAKGCFGTATCAIVIAHWLASQSIASYIVPVMMWVAGNAFALPILTMMAMRDFGRHAGQAAALLGFIQIICASIATWGIGHIPADVGVKITGLFCAGLGAILILDHFFKRDTRCPV